MELSEHLFWDVDRESIDFDRHAPWVVKRVLEYGLWADWQVLMGRYDRNRLREIVTQLRTLQSKAFAFCQVWFDLPADAFRCSSSTPFPTMSESS